MTKYESFSDGLDKAVALWFRIDCLPIKLFQLMGSCRPRLDHLRNHVYGRYGSVSLDCLRHGLILMKPIQEHTEAGYKSLLMQLLAEWNDHIGLTPPEPSPIVVTKEPSKPLGPYRRKFT